LFADHAKTAEYIASVLKKAMEKLGPQNVVQIVTDSAANCKAAGALLETEYPHLTWSPCAAHILDLCMEDIGRLKVVSDVVEVGKKANASIVEDHRRASGVGRRTKAGTDTKSAAKCEQFAPRLQGNAPATPWVGRPPSTPTRSRQRWSDRR
jgi:hypothetical protein